MPSTNTPIDTPKIQVLGFWREVNVLSCSTALICYPSSPFRLFGYHWRRLKMSIRTPVRNFYTPKNCPHPPKKCYPTSTPPAHWCDTKLNFEYSPGEYINSDYQSTPYPHVSCHTMPDELVCSNKDSPIKDDVFSNHGFSEAGSSSPYTSRSVSIATFSLVFIMINILIH